MKTLERQKATRLRERGLTYYEIGQLLAVSKSSLSLWLRNVPYEITNETRHKRKIASINTGQLQHQRKLERVNRIRQEAKQEITEINYEKLKLLGIMAYWAEGSKTKDSLVKFTNTDPNFISFTLKWLREVCNVPNDKIKVHIRVHNDIDSKKAENFWSKLTGMPRKNFYKTTIKKSGSCGKRYNKLNRGIAFIIVCDTNLFYKINGWIEALMDNISN